MSLRVIALLCAALMQPLTLLLVPSALAESIPPPILISEVQVADAEFIELYNTSAESISLSGWKLQYHATSSSKACNEDWSTILKLPAKSIPAYGYFLIGAKDLTPDAALTFTLSNTAAAIKLTDPAGAQLDALAWGKADCGLGTSVAAPAAGKSVERRPGLEFEAAGNAYNTQENADDFILRTSPQPQSAVSPPEEPMRDYAPAPLTAKSLPDIKINEIFPDPVSPLTDANDEFIELYNPNLESVDLAGYTIRTGTNLTNKYIITALSIPGRSYIALKSVDTGLTLSNTGSSVALYSPDGPQVGATITYEDAEPGQSWTRIEDTWSWSARTTPGEENILVEPLSSVIATAAAKTTTTTKSKTTQAKTTSAKNTSTKTTSAKETANKATKTTPKPVATTPPLTAAATTKGGHWLLFTLTGLTICYIIYEFRHDILNLYFRFRRHSAPRRTPRPVTSGRGGD